MANVLLLRAPSHGEEDRYEVAFAKSGFFSVSVPVLETISTNLATLKDIIKNGPTVENLDGVILTSARSCVAWKTSVDDLMSDSSVSEAEGSWSSIPFYVVGEATASALSQVRNAYGQTPFTPEIICGESSGTGERLAQYILEHPVKPKRLLFLTGDKNRDTVPAMLGSAGIDLHSLKVYETQESSTFERDLEQALGQARNSPFSRWWIVHFAPSAVRMVTPILANHFHSEFINSQSVPSISSVGVAAIGSVTAASLRDEFQIHVHVAPPKPTPQDLVSAIKAYNWDSVS